MEPQDAEQGLGDRTEQSQLSRKRAEEIRPDRTDENGASPESLESGSFYDRPDYHASWSPFRYDEQSRARIHAKLDELLEIAIEEEEASLTRACEEGVELIPTSLVVFAFTSGRKAGGASSAFRQRV